MRRKVAASDADVGYIARGWIEPAVGKAREGMFHGGQNEVVPSWLSFSPTGARAPDTEHISWKNVDAVRLVASSDMPLSAREAHAELFAWPGLDDPNFVVGMMASAAGIPRSDMFVIIPITVFRSGEQWLRLFARAGVSTETAT